MSLEQTAVLTEGGSLLGSADVRSADVLQSGTKGRLCVINYQQHSKGPEMTQLIVSRWGWRGCNCLTLFSCLETLNCAAAKGPSGDKGWAFSECINTDQAGPA